MLPNPPPFAHTHAIRGRLNIQGSLIMPLVSSLFQDISPLNKTVRQTRSSCFHTHCQGKYSLIAYLFSNPFWMCLQNVSNGTQTILPVPAFLSVLTPVCPSSSSLSCSSVSIPPYPCSPLFASAVSSLASWQLQRGLACLLPSFPFSVAWNQSFTLPPELEKAGEALNSLCSWVFRCLPGYTCSAL